MASTAEERPRRKSWHRRVSLILGVVVLVALVQTLPVFFPRPLWAKAYRGNEAVVYYQPGDEPGAREIFDLVEDKTAQIRRKMRFASTAPLEINVYKTQFSLALREAGFVTLIIAPPWFIGDSEAGVIRMVSPNTTVRGHTHDTILNGTLHEVVHSIDFYTNPKMSYWWDNGLATYLSNQTPTKKDLSYSARPAFEDLHTDDGLKFGNMGGYAYSYSYVAYLDEKYGWDQVLAFARGQKDYVQAFGRSEQQVYADWSESLK